VVNREAEPLRAALKQTWTEETWRAQALEYRRAILRIACERIEVRRAKDNYAKGRVGNAFDPTRVRVKFADE
jgi:hypothetical protein